MKKLNNINEKRICTLFGMVMLATMLMTCPALAAGNSKTTSNVGPASTAATEPVVVVVAEPTEETKAVLAEIEKVVAAGTPVVEYFGEKAAADIKAAVAEKAEALKLDELVPVVSSGVVDGVATVTVRTAASYTKDDAVVVLAGVTINGEKVWTVLNYTIVDGKLVITFPEEIAALLADGVIDLAILSAK